MLPWSATALALAAAIAAVPAPALAGKHRGRLAEEGPAAEAGTLGTTEAQPERERPRRHRHHRRERAARALRKRACRLDATASATSWTAGALPAVSGRLQCGTRLSPASQQVTLYEGVPGAGRRHSSAVASALTEADGSFRLTPDALDVTSVLFVRSGAAVSARIVVRVAPQITLEGPSGSSPLPLGRPRSRAGAASEPGAGTAVMFTGTVAPARAGEMVVLQHEQRDGQWSPIARTRTGAGGSFAIAHAFRVPGAVVVRAVVRAKRRVAAASSPLTYDVAGAAPGAARASDSRRRHGRRHAGTARAAHHGSRRTSA